MKILEIYQFFFITGLGFTALNLLILAIIMLALRANQKMYTEYFKDRSMANRAKPSGGPIGRLIKTPQAPIDKEKAAFTNPALGKTWPTAVLAAKALNEAIQTPHEAADCPDCPGIPKGLDKCDECEARAQEKPWDANECPVCLGLLCKSGAAQAECPGDIQCPDCKDRCPACNGIGKAS